jgi:hypothetical protein
VNRNSKKQIIHFLFPYFYFLFLFILSLSFSFFLSLFPFLFFFFQILFPLASLSLQRRTFVSLSHEAMAARKAGRGEGGRAMRSRMGAAALGGSGREVDDGVRRAAARI